MKEGFKTRKERFIKYRDQIKALEKYETWVITDCKPGSISSLVHYCNLLGEAQYKTHQIEIGYLIVRVK